MTVPPVEGVGLSQLLFSAKVPVQEYILRSQAQGGLRVRPRVCIAIGEGLQRVEECGRDQGAAGWCAELYTLRSKVLITRHDQT